MVVACGSESLNQLTVNARPSKLCCLRFRRPQLAATWSLKRTSTLVPPMRQHIGQRVMHMLIRSTCMRGSRSSGLQRAHVCRGVGEIGPDPCTPQNVQNGGYVLQCRNAARLGTAALAYSYSISAPVQLGRFTVEIFLERKGSVGGKRQVYRNRICI